MTVFVNKTEVDIREKLSELDYAHVPYQKMPAGSVIQTVSETYNTRSTTNSTAFTSTGFYVEISPKFKSSKILISVLTSGNNNNSVGHDLFATIFQITDNGFGGTQNLNLGNATYGFTGIRTNSAASGTNNRLEAGICMGYIDSPDTTDAIKYEIWFRSESSSSTVEIPQLIGQIASITAQEIKQ
jgi:hypothetical protein